MNVEKVPANLIRFEAADVPEAEPDIDDQCDEFQDVDMKLCFGGVGYWLAICKGPECNHIEAMMDQGIAMYAPHEVVGW